MSMTQLSGLGPYPPGSEMLHSKSQSESKIA